MVGVTTNQPSFLSASDLRSELQAAERHLNEHLDAVLSWTASRVLGGEPELEHHLIEVRYWATNVRVVSRLLEGAGC